MNWINKILKIIFERPSVQVPVKSWHYWLLSVLFLLLIPFPLFHGLDALVLRLWDEARRGVNAYEMLHNGNLLVTYYNGDPDMWGTKPPLLVWLQTGLMLIMGPSELAVRLPSAIAGLLTCIFIIWFSAKRLDNPFFGFIWAAVLITFNGYVDFHATRTGDYDALLTLFMFLYAIFFFQYASSKNPKFLFYTIIFITLATFTKGIGGLLFLPGMFLWAVISGKLAEIFRSRQFWIGTGIFLFVIGGYYLAREMVNPGYLEAVMGNEMGGRYLHSLEGHDMPFTFNMKLMLDMRLKKWGWFAIAGLVAGFFMKDKYARNLHFFSVILFLSHLLIISFSNTKLAWYDLPEYPFIALIIANLLWYIFSIFYRIGALLQKRLVLIMPLVFLAMVFYEPIRMTYKEAFYTQERPWYLNDHEIGIFLREGVRGQRDLDGFVLVNEGYGALCMFYTDLLKDKGQAVTWKSKENLSPGDRVMAYEGNVKDYIEGHYTVEVIESREFVKVYSIH